MTHGHAFLPNTCHYTAHTARGDYLVNVAWPLIWGEDRTPPEDEKHPLNVLYVVDGDVFFFTAVEITRRLEFTNNTRTIVVGVGYPRTKYVYDYRRGTDLTPPAADGKYQDPLGGDGKPISGLVWGEGSKYLDNIENDIMPYVNSLFPNVPIKTSRTALYGHSFGGVFALNALFTRPTLFDTVIAASPSISWNHCSIVKEQEAAFRALEKPVSPAPALIITWGSIEDDVEKTPEMTDKEYEVAKLLAEDANMRGYSLEMVERLEKCPSIRSVFKWEFEGEDHGDAAVVAIQRGLRKFLVEKV
ncbi:siderophore esterase IroE [Dactylonectria estremocensis]|uniref:Siderophore esterase IroE n=1 Tax=Dactylonectria estremocensis TaxID=1079267 RepID=A0A9P9EM66_9HYPO|nr:siderophore esterase IroE [Dactylonectria estremocensis]